MAYVRHTQRADTRFDGAGIAPLPAICAIRMIDYDGTGDHEVLRMAEGLWVTRIAWSPDGTEIVFDLESSPDSTTWNRVRRDVATATEQVLTIELPTGGAQRFFRLVTR